MRPYLRRSGGRAAIGWGLLAALTLAAVSVNAQEKPRANPEAQLLYEFTKRVQAYDDLHQKLEATLPPLPAKPTAEALDAHQRALSRLIVRARSGAEQGSIFTRDIRRFFRGLIARALSGPDRADLRREIMDENPGRIRLRVNGPYPADAPFSTMPVEILAVLPKLPSHLEYRFSGERLILLDPHANLVVDYIEEALDR